jgi:hypothetical protein
MPIVQPLVEMKMCLARLLYKYKIHPTDDAYRGELVSKEAVQIMPQNVYIKLEDRHANE